MISVVLVDDHETVRLGVSAYLSTQTDIEVIGEASDGREGVERALELLPNVIIMDLVMSPMNGVDATKEIKEKWPEAKVLVVTSFVDEEMLTPALQAGASSYVLKTSSAKEIADAIRKTYAGESVLDPKVQGKMLSLYKTPQVALHEQLTTREREILKLMAEGKSNRTIAEELFITIKTVKTHVSHVLQKLEVEDRTQAVVYAFDYKLFS
ncbi:response regulator transcription factor [Geomicrobium sp. JCM 19039]|uniref:response regulator n=1 Tax=Geomicrobium sp. JCM 19039 TaxID=1460636 RepID=UPI00045F2679|nr:response regulator transcription factor [Geomicrobium sp. JCM 19039]GAK14222.1 two component transcriptional regulator VraR [Geomicrobium sp. JCM 19039]